MENPNLDNIVFALLFASDEALSARKIAAVIEDTTVADVKKAIEAWNQRADAEAWSVGIEQVAGGYRLVTRPEYAPYVSRLYTGRRKLRLSRAGLETLAIVAYKQPVTRAEIEVIRGVGCGSVVANLLERSLVQIVGKAKVLGAPFLYGTTPEFLEYLGLNSINDLPSLEDLEALLASEAAEETAVQNGAEEPQTELAGVLEDAIEDGAEPELDDDGRPVASAAQLGALVDEPVNRPLYSGPKKKPGEAGGGAPPKAEAEDDTEEDAEEHSR